MEQIRSKKLTLILVIFLLLVLPVALFLSKQRQEIRKKAGSTPHILLSATTAKAGVDVVYATVQAIPTTTLWVKGVLSFNADDWEIVGSVTDKISAVIFTDAWSGGNVYTLIAGAHNAGSPIGGNLFKVGLKPKVKGVTSRTGSVRLDLTVVDSNASSVSYQEDATLIVTEPSPTPTPTAVPGAPNNSVTPASAQATLGADGYYQVEIRPSASPAVSGDAAGNVVKYIGAAPGQVVTKANLAGCYSAAWPSTGIVCQKFLNVQTVKFNLGGDRKVCAIFHNNPALADGWSDPVCTGTIIMAPVMLTKTIVADANITNANRQVGFTPATNVMPNADSAGKVVKYIGAGFGQAVTKDSFGGICADGWPSTSPVCKTTVAHETFQFNAGSGGGVKICAIFHNDIVAVDGWSNPVCTATEIQFPTASPTATSISTPTAIPTATPVSTPTSTPTVTLTPTPTATLLADCHSCNQSNQCVFDAGCVNSSRRCNANADCVATTPTPTSVAGGVAGEVMSPLDGHVGAGDLAYVAGHYDPTCMSTPAPGSLSSSSTGDFNHNGCVDAGDLAVTAGAYNSNY